MENVSSKFVYDMAELNIIVVDDQDDVRRGLSRLIQTLGCDVKTAASGEQALAQLKNDDFDIVFTDLKMPGISGVDLLHEINRRYKNVDVVLITGHGTIEIAVSCLQNGASHFITKPFDNKEILGYIKHAGYRILTKKYTVQSMNRYKSRSIIAIDKSMQRVLDLVNRVAPSKAPVLIQGESGSGKELIAHEIHNRSGLSEKAFVAINCIALPDSLLESELFGYKKGAFTGAHQDSRGLFEQVNGGTIFLDEVSGMSLQFQGKLLRVLQEKAVRPLGGSQDIAVDFRLIAASNQNLEELAAAGKFREDLFYRLNVVKIEIPPLAQRPACIPALAEYFLKQAACEFFGVSESPPKLAPTVIELLKNYHWKGNVRELENTIQRSLIVCEGDTIQPAHLGLNIHLPAETSLMDSRELSYEQGKQRAIESFQRIYVENILRRTKGNISRAAEICGLTRAAFQRIMRKLAIERLSVL